MLQVLVEGANVDNLSELDMAILGTAAVFGDTELGTAAVFGDTELKVPFSNQLLHLQLLSHHQI
ncbi:unnamed protein product [Acanthoscelides obtectus]|uniref:Uncharacterized protein n=1 Tax=Acanthoscelides obtectus TaxID=200917 RepID=A0A9P0PQI0_ACAOB|nr:unnamed protein product [Acanthoscelides obtectus]CAK1641848.1 hypothetical protein AOBTE_LOCUS12675 [Acanthoscelides obtectus]